MMCALPRPGDLEILKKYHEGRDALRIATEFKMDPKQVIHSIQAFNKFKIIQPYHTVDEIAAKGLRYLMKMPAHKPTPERLQLELRWAFDVTKADNLYEIICLAWNTWLKKIREDQARYRPKLLAYFQEKAKTHVFALSLNFQLQESDPVKMTQLALDNYQQNHGEFYGCGYTVLLIDKRTRLVYREDLIYSLL
jgi:hypothetical protein